MSIRRRGRGCRATLALRLATVCAAAVTLVPVAAESASAYVPCPGPISSAEILNWQYRWPTPGADPKGVTLCEGFGSVLRKGYLQIVDLNDGAKLRLVSQLDPSSPTPSKYEPYTKYQKRTVDEWYSHIKNGNSIQQPATTRLFSTTNASFFKDSDNGNPTALTFPHRFDLLHETWGAAMWERWGVPTTCPDPNAFDYCAAKRLLRIGSPGDQPQKVGVEPSFTLYDAPMAEMLLRDGYQQPWQGSWDATMGFGPQVQVGDEARRNYIGTYNNVVYIWTSDKEYTNAQAYDLMQQIQPGMSVMQLDGGGSAQMHSEYGWMDSNIPVLDRKVPDVLAVYQAP